MLKAVRRAGLIVVVLASCSLSPGEPQYVRGYRLVDDRTVSVLADTSSGVEPVGEDIWLTLMLSAPLGNREVIDAVTKRAVEAVP